MAKVVTQEGLIDTKRMQDAESSYDDEGDRGSPDDIRNEIYKSVDQLRQRDDDDDAETEYVDTVIRSNGKVAEALPQTMNFVNGARYAPIQAAQDLEDHYKSIPRHMLHQPKPVEPAYDHPDEYENIRRAIQWSVQQEERKQEIARQRAMAKDAMEEFRKQNGNQTAGMYRSMVHLHEKMSADPTDTAVRLPVQIIADTFERQKDAAGMQSAHAEAAAFFEKYPKAEKYRDKMAHLLKNGGASTLEEAAGIASGLWPIRHSVSSEGHRADLELDVMTARALLPDQPETRHRRVYSDAEKDVMKAVKDLRGE